MSTPPDRQFWGYDFRCGKTVDALLAAFNAAGPWQWALGDSDFYGFYVKCRPDGRAEVRVFQAAQFRTSQATDPTEFWAELASDATLRPEIARQFLSLLDSVNATDVTET